MGAAFISSWLFWLFTYIIINKFKFTILSTEVPSDNNIPTDIYELPQDIINTCKIIWDRTNKTIDPTKICYIWVPDTVVAYEIHSPNPETDSPELLEDILEESMNKSQESMLAWFLCQWILNVSQVCKRGGSYFSLEIWDKNITELLSFDEIFADICLFQVLIEWSASEPSDRRLGLTDDITSERSKISSHNCTISKRGTYSIFDVVTHIEQVYDRESLLQTFVENIMYLQDLNVLDTYRMIVHSIWISNKSIQRIINRVSLFLERYDNTAWKDLFYSQCIKSELFEDNREIDDAYTNFISNLKLILTTFSKDINCISRHMLRPSFLEKIKTKLQTYLDSKFESDYKLAHQILENRDRKI